MKVVLFCGGLGTRLREHSETIPKALVPIGARPIIWHLMKFYAHHGHTEFILCLGYGGYQIRRFFLEYDPREANDFVMGPGGSRLVRTETDVQDWTIHFADTGLNANIGERLMAIRDLVEHEQLFFANYSDQLSNLPLPVYLDWFLERNAVASFIAVKPSQSFHLVDSDANGRVRRLGPVADADVWINGGYMILRPDVFSHMRQGDELVEEPFERLTQAGLLAAYRFQGFWKAMDTIKDKLSYDAMDARGERPWMVWR